MTSLSTTPSHLDRTLLLIGSPGRFQLLVAFLLCCMQFPISFSNHILDFYAITPKHRCRADSNFTFGDYELRPIVTINGKRQYSSCELYENPLDHSKGTKLCDNGWEFLINPGESSVVTEWELVCNREYLAALLPYVTTVAGMIGALLSGFLSDKYGRKYVLLLSLLLHTTFGIFLHFLPVYGIFITIFSGQSFLIAGIQITSYLLLIENLPTEWHDRAALAIAVFQCIGQMILAVLSWIIRHWRYIQLVISAPGVVVVGYFWLLPSSLAWLVLENRQQSAQLTLAKFSDEATFKMTPDLRIQLLKSCRVGLFMPGGYAARHGFETIICSARLRKLAFIQFYIWFVISLTSKCSVEEVPALKNNPYSRLFVHGVLGLSFVILMHLASSSIGLKMTQGISLTISGICCMFSAIVNHQVIQMKFRFVAEKGLHNFAPVFALLGQSIASAIWMTLWLHAVKTFPTGVRSLGIGLCMFWAGVANLFQPDIAELGAHSRFVVLALCGVLSSIAGFLTLLFLPDCSGRPIATIAEEVEVSRTKIINDSDLDYRDTNMTGFVPNISTEERDNQSQSTSSSNDSRHKSLRCLRRLASIIRIKMQTFLKPPAPPLSKLTCSKQMAPIGVVKGSDVFEPVTGFVFKWDKAEPAVRITDFEKEISTYWKPNNDPSEKELNDKHLNSLNILYNINRNAVLDIQNADELADNCEHGNDSTL